ncbi:hypothetical protein F5Y07DRAFT_405762 [Xylaria sp. FL0933]|nr:hypothetical protein F5Y07DRAFT_405762 [Xylaria sp. FL0933]
MSPKNNRPEPIAIIGTACRFPGGASSPSKLWDLLRSPRDVRTEIPNSRFNARGFYHEDPMRPGHTNVMHAYLLTENPLNFDTEFFKINASEARAMDPQQRFLLEVVYEALESAGLSIESLRGSDTAVYAGAMRWDYEKLLLRDIDQISGYLEMTSAHAVLSGRISSFLDWHGASVTLDTGCSSSFVAVYQAAQTLRSGDSHIAVACGSNLILGPEVYISGVKSDHLSPDSRSRMWDKDANGFARGEGVAAVILKTLKQAVADGDRIEAVIRETSVNHDGAKPSMTMPSASAQSALVRSVYSKAGLDPENPIHQPQYIEAHGVGTKIGDPIEAEGLSKAFFPLDGKAPDRPIYTGSIKTVLGHSEAISGIAELLKVIYAMKHSTIPPNLLFNQINPAVAPFYTHFQVPTDALPWPCVPEKQPKRASIHNLGIGGTNTHVILESYEKPRDASLVITDDESTTAVLTPFVFSAASDEALRANLSAYAAYLDTRPDINIHDLAYTLRERRSALQYRTTVSATTVSSLTSGLRARLAESSNSSLGVQTCTSIDGKRPTILGIFTGQAAQYARMAAELIEQSPLARHIIQTLESCLAQLPEHDRPNWSLSSELLADSSVSRVGEAAISQPLCVAVQVMIIDLLQCANIRFDAVVGHSSGEISAAYAAGFLSARDAIVIAYYRGLVSQLAASPNGKSKGAMLAVGTSLQDATDLCNDEEFAGRISVAASNSSSNVTISGDEDAIDELVVVLEDENKFNRRLNVDKAYHSRHMLPCVSSYMEALRKVGVRTLPGNDQCIWFSSVHDGKRIDQTNQLNDTYWAENLTKPVLFSQAVQAATSAVMVQVEDASSVVLEVGPHPALTGPAMENIEEIARKKPPYHGTLLRDTDATVAFSNCLGFLWAHLDNAWMSLASCETALSGDHRPPQQRFNILGDLPSYQWNHGIAYSNESRKSRRIQQRGPYHQLLGTMSPDSAPHVLRWKNILQLSSMPWLEGHTIQKQIILPFALYLSTAIEAARSLTIGKNIRLIELSHFKVHRSVTCPDDDRTGIEVHIELAQVNMKPDFAAATFTYSAALGDELADLVLIASGELKVLLGDIEPCPAVLSERQPTPPYLKPVDINQQYDFWESLEHKLSGPFRSLIEMDRKSGRAICVGRKAKTSIQNTDSLLIHPVDLDAPLLSTLVAHNYYAGDSSLKQLYLPVSIEMVRINPAVLASQEYAKENTILLDATCFRENQSAPKRGFYANCSIYTPSITHEAVQIDGLLTKPADPGNISLRGIFYRTLWVPTQPDGVTAAANIPNTGYDSELALLFNRLAAFYLRQFDDLVSEDDPARTENPLCHYLNYARYVRGLVSKADSDWVKREWANDREEDLINEIRAKGASNSVDVELMLFVGRTMPAVFRGETTMVEQFRASGLLDEYYSTGRGSEQSATWIGNIVKQLTDRNPHLNLLEIGAGTGGATKRILEAIGHDFGQYTFTDISPGFFENATEKFREWKDHMVFEVYNAELDPADQGYKPGTYDVVISWMVVHGCERLAVALANLRKFLKPGGLLILGEPDKEHPTAITKSFIFGALPGWWRGVVEGRALSPLMSLTEWDPLLKSAGFSGIDTVWPTQLFDTSGLRLVVSTALDENIKFSRDPLAAFSGSVFQKVILIGGHTPAIAKLARDLETILIPYSEQFFTYESLDHLGENTVDAGSTVISLIDLESPVFQNLTAERWYKFRTLFEAEINMLWLTKNRLSSEPYCNMTVAFGRSAMREQENLHVQYIDFPDIGMIDARTVAQYLLRFTALQLEDNNILYTKETEVLINSQGKELVPRLVPLNEANDRYSSATRPIFQQVDVSKTAVELYHDRDSNKMTLRKLSRFETSTESRLMQASKGEVIQLYVTHSTTNALQTPAGCQFLVLGMDTSGAQYLALISSVTSAPKVPMESTVSCNPSKGSEAEYLTLIAAELVAMAIISPLYAGQKLILHNAFDTVERAVIARAMWKGINITITRDPVKSRLACPVPSIEVPSYLRPYEMAQLLPTDVACFTDLSATMDSAASLTILSCLPSYCRKENRRTLFSSHGYYTGCPLGVLSQMLHQAIHYHAGQDSSLPTQVLSLEAVADGKSLEYPLTIIDWKSPSSSLPARVTRIESGLLFKNDKTYWIVGLSETLGVALGDWMIDHGARYLVFSSRNPKIDTRWLKDHQRHGVIIRILPCDITDETAVRAVHQIIVDSHPPIVGLVNGAMVLRDVSLSRMEFEQLTDVIRPKLQGSTYLDNVFHDTNLDFFVMLSSIVCIAGNAGQANYAAAGMGINSVAVNRRRRGLRSSVVNLSPIVGAGYITDSSAEQILRGTQLLPLSELDFNHVFSECIEAGYPDSPSGPEISIVPLDISRSKPIAKWRRDSKFTHLRVRQTSIGNSDNEPPERSASIRELLQKCETQQDLLLVIREAYSAQLRKKLQLSIADDDLMKMRSGQLGLDSLVSVDVRSWFLKHFQVNIPTLRILSKETPMSSLAELVAQEIPAELIPAALQSNFISNEAGSSQDAEVVTPEYPKTKPEEEEAAMKILESTAEV